jgi:hypothetical protein
MTRNLFQKILFLFFLISAASLPAQQLAILNVTVTDPSGSLVPGAHITVSNSSTGLSPGDSHTRYEDQTECEHGEESIHRTGEPPRHREDETL